MIQVFLWSNYSANTAAITLAPIKGRLCGAKRGENNNYIKLIPSHLTYFSPLNALKKALDDGDCKST